MNIQIFVGLFTEGTTDIRFLESIVKRTLDDLAFQCHGQIETELLTLNICKTGLSFIEQVSQASQMGINDYGISILCVHTDADNNLQRITKTKVEPSLKFIKSLPDKEFCKTLAFIVPVQMVESWMLADKQLFKEEINTNCTDIELQINFQPETLANPKQIIESAIRISKEDQTRRKRSKGIKISDLYQILGQKLDLKALENLPSFLRFKQELKNALIELNYM